MEAPVVIFSASHDTLSPPTEQKYFAANLPNMKDFRLGLQLELKIRAQPHP